MSANFSSDPPFGEPSEPILFWFMKTRFFWFGIGLVAGCIMTAIAAKADEYKTECNIFSQPSTVVCLLREVSSSQEQIATLQKQVEELKGKPCVPPAPVSEPERQANPLGCDLTAFRGYDERNNTYNDFAYLHSKEPRFNDTNATVESRKWFHCRTLYRRQVSNHRDP